MKKLYFMFATFMMALAFAACGSDDEDVQAGKQSGATICLHRLWIPTIQR